MSVWSCIRYLLILSVSAWCGRYLAQDPGYLVIQYHGYNIETSLFFVLLLALLFISFLIMLSQVLRGISFSGRHLVSALLPNRERHYQQQLLTGINYSLAQQPQAAAIAFSKAHEKKPSIPILLAAIYQTPAEKPVEHLLEQAYIEYPQDTNLVDLIFIHRLIQAQQYTAALEKLQGLPKTANGPAKDYLLLLVCRATDNWQFMKSLINSRFLSTAQKARVQQDYAQARLRQTPSKQIQKVWKQLPRDCKNIDTVADLYIGKLVENQQIPLAIKTLESLLTKQPTPICAARYSQITTDNIPAQLSFLLSLLTQHPTNESIIWAISTLYEKQGETLKAMVYIEKIINTTQSIPILWAGASLYQTLNRHSHAQALYQRIQDLQT